MKSFINILSVILLTSHVGIAQNTAYDNSKILVVSNIDITDVSIIKHLQNLRTEHSDKSDISLVILGGLLNDLSDEPKIISHVRYLKEQYQKVYIIPGTPVWEVLGAKGLKELDDKLQDEFKQDVLIPDNACGELEIKELSDDLIIGAFDSEWYLKNWNEDNYINRGCAIRDRTLFWRHFDDEISGEKDHTVVLFAYHPPVRYDKSAGFYPPAHHMLPLPLVGSILTKITSHSRGQKKATHPRYKEYADRLTNIVALQPNVLMVSAEGKYQMDHMSDEKPYLNVNSGEEKEFIADKKVNWAHTAPSYIFIEVSEDTIKNSWYDYHNGEKLYARATPKNREIIDEIDPEDHKIDDLRPDSITTSIFNKGDILDLNDFLFGDLNTDIHYQKIRVPILDLKTYKNGLKASRIGGGKQTQSVRLSGGEDDFVVRSLQKSADKLIPSPFDISPVKSIVDYYFTASNPFGFLVSSKLEESLNLLRTDPKLVFLPTQEALTPYNDEVGNRLVLFRARAKGDMHEYDNLGNSKEIISSEDFHDEIVHNDAKPDAALFLKARLLDLLVNDWDRHDDQWRWAKDLDKGDLVDTYYPIPRDRDQALSNYDGLMLGYMRQFVPRIFQLRPFDDKLSKEDIKWLHYLASFMEKTMLTELTKDEWMTITKEVVNELTDEDINSAVNAMPAAVSQDSKNWIITNLTSRRDDLLNTSEFLYELVNENALVYCSEKKDIIHINSSETMTEVEVTSKIKDDIYFRKFIKTFTPDITKEIWVYGLDGKDSIIVTGISGKIKIRILGGFGIDSYDIENTVKEKVIIYDKDQEDKISHKGRTILSDGNEVVSLGRTDFMLSHNSYLPQFNINSDDGIFLGGTYNLSTYGFKKKWNHNIFASYATKRKSTYFSYTGTFSNKFQEWDKFVRLSYFGPRYEFNYFGFGNDSNLDPNRADAYYYVRQKESHIELGLSKMQNQIADVTLSLKASRYRVENVADRFLSSEQNINPEIFENQFFVGVSSSYDLNNFDNLLKPHNGIQLKGTFEANKHINSGDKDHVSIDGFIKIYQSIGSLENIVFSSKAGYTKVWGDQYFYQAPSLGGERSLRGFRLDRFYGESALYHHNNLHYYISHSHAKNDKSHSWGITASLDYGRVWSKQDISNIWHVNYGIGLFFSPLDVVVINANIFFSKEDKQIRIGTGWPL